MKIIKFSQDNQSINLCIIIVITFLYTLKLYRPSDSQYIGLDRQYRTVVGKHQQREFNKLIIPLLYSFCIIHVVDSFSWLYVKLFWVHTWGTWHGTQVIRWQLWKIKYCLCLSIVRNGFFFHSLIYAFL